MELKIISNALSLFQGQSCWSIIAGAGTGSVLSLGFGAKIPRKKKLTCKYRTTDEAQFNAEFGLFVECSWRLHDFEKVLCTSTSSNSHGEVMLNGLEKLRDLRIEGFNLHPITLDMELYFSDRICLSIFAGNTLSMDELDNYTVFTPAKYYVLTYTGTLNIVDQAVS